MARTKRRTAAEIGPRDVAAYLMDRADQYETASPCWIALADAAHNVMNGAITEAVGNGDFGADLYVRVDRFRRPGAKLKPVDPNLGVDDDGEAEHVVLAADERKADARRSR